MNIKMKNSYIICDDSVEASNETESGFSTINLDRFKKVKVIQSNEEDVPVGSEVKISINAGEKDELGLVIRRTDIIYIL